MEISKALTVFECGKHVESPDQTVTRSAVTVTRVELDACAGSKLTV